MHEVVSLAATVLAVLLSRRFARSTMQGFTGVCVTIAICAITWNDIKPLAFPLSDLLLLLATIPIMLKIIRGEVRGPLPFACLCGVALVALAVILNAIFPISQMYAEARYAGDPGIVRPVAQSEFVRVATSLEVGVKLIVGMFILPLAVMIVAPDRERLRTLFDLWAISGLVNTVVALLGAVHIFESQVYLIGPATAGSSRQFGLTNHPNHLATTLVMTLPLVLTWWRRGPQWRRRSVIALLAIAAAIVASGSRGGLAAGGGVIVLAILSQREVRRAVLPLAAVGVLIVGAILVIDFNLVHQVLHHTRLSSNSGNGSDSQRAEVARQAVLDIKHRPLLGVGFDVADQGHSIYLQAIASGGVITLLGLILYLGGVISGLRIWRPDEWRMVEMAAAVSMVGWLVLGAIENDYADRYPYVPFAFLLAIAAVRATTRRNEAARATEPPILIRGPMPAPVPEPLSVI